MGFLQRLKAKVAKIVKSNDFFHLADKRLER